MNTPCPFRHTSFATWRLQVVGHLLGSHPIDPVLFSFPRLFSVSSPANVRRTPLGLNRRRRARKKAISDEYSRLLELQSEASGLVQRYTGKQPSEYEELSNLPSKSLPRSFLEVRLPRGEKVRKRMPTKQDRDYLRYNPYAQALASPVRQCSATGARLPSAFLVGWGLIQHPDTKNLWFMPTSLLEQELRKSRDIPAEVKLSDGDTPKSVLPRSHIPPLYLSNSREILDGIISRPTRMLPKHLIPMAWKIPFGQISKVAERNIVWRDDMPEFVLKRLRKKTVELLKMARLFPKTPSGISGCIILDMKKAGVSGLREALTCLEPNDSYIIWGAILIMKHGSVRQPEKSGNDNPSLDGEPTQSHSAYVFPDFIDLPNEDIKVPVFDLTKLLTEGDRHDLSSVSYFRGDALFLQSGSTLSMRMILQLWQLKQYMQ